MPARLHLLIAALSLGSTSMPAMGCSDGLPRRVRSPENGVQLRYALAVGTQLDGRIRVGTTRTIEGLKDHLTQSIDCDARLLIAEAAPDGSVVAHATFRKVQLDWSTPPDVGLSTEAFAKLAGQELAGLTLAFRLSPRGKLLSLPSSLDRTSPELLGLVDTLGLAVASGFVEAPARALSPGETWTDTAPAQLRRTGGPEIHARFEGLVRPGRGRSGRGPNLARIRQSFTRSAEVDADGGPGRRQTEGDTLAHLNDVGVLVEVETELRDFDPVRGLAVQQLHTQWALVEAGRDLTTSVQDIEDPCDPDYVGAAPCTTGG